MSSVRSIRACPSSIEVARARSSWPGKPGSAKPGCSGSSRIAPRGAATLSSPAQRRNWSRICPSQSSSMRSTSTFEASDRQASPLWTMTSARSSGHVFPSLSALGRGRAAALQHERYRSHRAIRLLLEQLATTKPFVLVLDDFHWADAASAELLGALLRRPPAGAVLIALGVRPRQMPERLAAAFERAQRAGTLTRSELGPLTQAEARDFLGTAVERAEAAALYEESGGNPFYLEQLARSLEYTGTDATGVAELSAAIGVPSTVAAALTEELALLSDEARRVLEGAAVAGDPFEPELAAAAAATPESAALDALDRLLQCALVRTTDVP